MQHLAAEAVFFSALAIAGVVGWRSGLESPGNHLFASLFCRTKKTGRGGGGRVRADLSVSLHVAVVDELRLADSANEPSSVVDSCLAGTHATHARTPAAASGGVALVPGIENVVVEGLVGVVGAEAAGGDKTRVALERREEHLCDARWASGTRTHVSPQDTLCQPRWRASHPRPRALPAMRGRPLSYILGFSTGAPTYRVLYDLWHLTNPATAFVPKTAVAGPVSDVRLAPVSLHLLCDFFADMGKPVEAAEMYCRMSACAVVRRDCRCRRCSGRRGGRAALTPGAPLQHPALLRVLACCCVCILAASAPAPPLMRDPLPAGAAAARRRARTEAGGPCAEAALAAAASEKEGERATRARTTRHGPSRARPMPTPSQRCQFRGARHENATGTTARGAEGSNAPEGDNEGQRCGRWPSYGDPADRKARFCRTHAAPGHVNLKSRRCQAVGCTRQASFLKPATLNAT